MTDFVRICGSKEIILNLRVPSVCPHTVFQIRTSTNIPYIIQSVYAWCHPDLILARPQRMPSCFLWSAVMPASHCRAPAIGRIDGHLSLVKTVFHVSFVLSNLNTLAPTFHNDWQFFKSFNIPGPYTYTIGASTWLTKKLAAATHAKPPVNWLKIWHIYVNVVEVSERLTGITTRFI